MGPEVVSALVEPITADTSLPERRRILEAAFSVSGGDGSPAISALVRRLREEDRADAEMVLRIVRYRTAATP